MDITLPQEQQDWLAAEVGASRFSSIDEAIAVAVASYMAWDSADANSALDEFRRDLRSTMADPSGWRTASPLSQRSTIAAGDAELEDLTARSRGSGAIGHEPDGAGHDPQAGGYQAPDYQVDTAGHEAGADESQPEDCSPPQSEEAEIEAEAARLVPDEDGLGPEEDDDLRRPGRVQPDEQRAITSLSASYGTPGGIEIPEPRSRWSV